MNRKQRRNEIEISAQVQRNKDRLTAEYLLETALMERRFAGRAKCDEAHDYHIVNAQKMERIVASIISPAFVDEYLNIYTDDWGHA
jgi:hypothetical protein